MKKIFTTFKNFLKENNNIISEDMIYRDVLADFIAFSVPHFIHQFCMPRNGKSEMIFDMMQTMFTNPNNPLYIDSDMDTMYEIWEGDPFFPGQEPIFIKGRNEEYFWKDEEGLEDYKARTQKEILLNGLSLNKNDTIQRKKM